MRMPRMGWWLVFLGAVACGQSALPVSPQGQGRQDAAADAEPPAVDADARAPAPAPSDAEPPRARDAALPVRDAAAPTAPDATVLPRDAGMPGRTPTPASDEDAGEARDEPVACAADEQPPSGSTCATEGEVCAHWRTDPATGYDAYFACNCIAASSTRLAWNCYENLSGSVQCPHDRPESDSSCDGYRDRTCPYPPRVRCTCPLDAADLRWECSEGTTAPEAPSTWPLSTAVRELDDATRQTFCAWFVDATTDDRQPDPPEPPPTPDGYFPTSGCSGCGGGPGFGGMMPFPLPASACAANLALSTCEQPLSELVDCVRSLLSECWPSPRGCARYLEAPGCAGTLIVKTAAAGLVDCRIKVR